MARQNNIFKMKGTIGDATFYKSQDGHLVREKGGIDGDRIKNDPRFQRTRENGFEFGYSGRMGKLIRDAFKTVVNQSADNRLVSRLVRNIMEVVKTDTTSARGSRNLLNGDIALLQGLEFNANARLSVSFTVPYDVAVNRAGGEVSITASNFVPDVQVSFPVGATHCKLVGGAATIDFAAGSYTIASDQGSPIPLTNTEVPASSLTFNISANTTLPVFVALGVEFYQEVNNSLYLLRNGGYNAIAIVKVDALP